MPANPTCGSKVRKAVDMATGKSRKGRCQVVADGDFQPPAAFYNRQNRRDLRPRLWAADVDPPDNRILECAVEGKSEYIVTRDNDLLRLRSYAGMKIIKVAEFLGIARASGVCGL